MKRTDWPRSLAYLYLCAILGQSMAYLPYTRNPWMAIALLLFSIGVLIFYGEAGRK